MNNHNKREQNYLNRFNRTEQHNLNPNVQNRTGHYQPMSNSMNDRFYDRNDQSYSHQDYIGNRNTANQNTPGWTPRENLPDNSQNYPALRHRGTHAADHNREDDHYGMETMDHYDQGENPEADSRARNPGTDSVAADAGRDPLRTRSTCRRRASRVRRAALSRAARR